MLYVRRSSDSSEDPYKGRKEFRYYLTSRVSYYNSDISHVLISLLLQWVQQTPAGRVAGTW